MQRTDTLASHADKQQHWNIVVEQLRLVTDALSLPIDEGIEVVVTLNALGLSTSASCQGHLDLGEGAAPYPWIEIAPTPDPKRTLHEDICQALLPREHFMNYLERFYRDRIVPLDQRLTIQILYLPDWIHVSRLEPQGAALQELRPSEEKALHLACYRAEIADLTSFLTCCYWIE